MRIHIVWWLALLLTLCGCISTDRPILTREKSEAPSGLVGLWDRDVLVEAVDQHTLRLTWIHKSGEIIFRGPLHTVRLAGAFFLQENPRGLHIVQLDSADRLFIAGVAPGVTEAQVQGLARTYDTRIDLAAHPATKNGATLSIDRIGGTDEKRLVALLNDLIARKMMMSLGDPRLRTTEPSAHERVRSTVVRYDAKRAADFSAALATLKGDATSRSKGCSDMAELHITGYVEATAQLGRCHLYGWYGQDPAVGFDILLLAEAFGNATAADELRKVYAEGVGGQTLVHWLALAMRRAEPSQRDRLARQLAHAARASCTKRSEAGALRVSIDECARRSIEIENFSLDIKDTRKDLESDIRNAEAERERLVKERERIRDEIEKLEREKKR